MSASERLAASGVELPPVVAPVGAYLPAKVFAGQVLTSGQLPVDAGGRLVAGRVGEDLDVADGQRAARIAVVNALAAAASVAGGLDAIREVVRVLVFVNSAPGFTDQALVANGASELLGEVFGEAGRHVRSAVGVASLPKGAAVEVELVVGI